MDVTGDGSKVQCFKKQNCIRTWNIRFMNQGKLQVVKQETARENVNNLGISKLKWIGMGEFNSDEHCIYYCRQESLLAVLSRQEMEYHHSQQKSLKCSTWMQSQKQQNDLCFQGIPFKIMVIQVYVPTGMLKKLKLNSSMKTDKTF